MIGTEGGVVVVEEAEKPVRITGEDAKRIKREALGVPDRQKHQGRPARRMRSREKESGTRHRVYRYRFYPTEAQAG
ncbi:hypothetical protein P8605_37295 [Streptomyces sp. T-3]|nr:hypothetical protein [Streptomyces sp. T-3]